MRWTSEPCPQINTDKHGSKPKFLPRMNTDNADRKRQRESGVTNLVYELSRIEAQNPVTRRKTSSGVERQILSTNPSREARVAPSGAHQEHEGKPYQNETVERCGAKATNFVHEPMPRGPCGAERPASGARQSYTKTKPSSGVERAQLATESNEKAVRQQDGLLFQGRIVPTEFKKDHQNFLAKSYWAAKGSVKEFLENKCICFQ